MQLQGCVTRELLDPIGGFLATLNRTHQRRELGLHALELIAGGQHRIDAIAHQVQAFLHYTKCRVQRDISSSKGQHLLGAG